MKIVYLARRAIPSVHAHSVQIVKMSEAFAKLGHDVLLLAGRGDEEPVGVYSRYGVERSFSIESYPQRATKLFSKWRFGLHLLAHPKVRSADLFFGRDIFSLAVASLLGKPIIFEAHAIPRRGGLAWRLSNRLFASKNFSHLVCVTSTLADSYRQNFETLKGKMVMVAPNGAADFKSGPKMRVWPGRPGVTQIGFVGRPFPGKGIELMVSAAADMPACDFHVVGASEGDVDWIEGRFPPNLHFHGYQPHGRLGAYQRRFDIAVAPYCEQVMNASEKESAAITSPLKLLEYMAAGLPVVTSDLPGVRDILGDEDFAAIIAPGDARALVSALRRLARDPDLRRKLGKAARKSFLERHTLEARARRVLEPAVAAAS
jgi:glycosyltransferase involved in cell wall biosynthesis